MPGISLQIFRVPHPPASQIGYALDAIRLLAHVTFKSAARWNAYRPGIVDTGAAVSLIPAEIWRDTDHQVIGPVRVGGVIARDECRVDARLATLTCALSDGVSVIGPMTIRAYLVESDEVPLLLGVCDLIENGVLTVDIGHCQATFEQ